MQEYQYLVPLMHIDLEKFKHQFEVNVFGQIAVTQAFLPLMGADIHFKGNPGRIVMMSSVSGKMSYPFIGPYCASKHALEALSDSLRRELQLFGIKVILIEPGPVKTDIWYKGDEETGAQIAKTAFAASAKKFVELSLKAGKKWY